MHYFLAFHSNSYSFIHLIRIAPKAYPFLSSKNALKTNNINTEIYLQIDNVTLKPDNANESSGKDEGEGLEEEALEGPKLQSRAEELEIINLSDEEEAREIRVGKQMSLYLRQRLVELLKEYANVFAWSY
ncbi:hypothetical protein CR513_62168, partial [Mucuna pruriens]